MLGCIGYYKINLTQSIIISLSSLVTIFSFGLRDGVGISAFQLSTVKQFLPQWIMTVRDFIMNETVVNYQLD